MPLPMHRIDNLRSLLIETCWTCSPAGARLSAVGGQAEIASSRAVLGSSGTAAGFDKSMAYIIETFPERGFSDSTVRERRSVFGAPTADYHSKSLRRFRRRLLVTRSLYKYKKGASGNSLDNSHPAPPARDTNACKAIPATASKHCDTHIHLQHTSVNICTNHFREIVPLHTAQDDCPQH